MQEAIKNLVKPRKGFDDVIGDFDSSDGPGNPRCLWDRSICTRSVSHHITFGFVRDDGERELLAQTYCSRHYAVELAHFVEFHSPRCSISIGEHLYNFGALDS